MAEVNRPLASAGVDGKTILMPAAFKKLAWVDCE